MPAKGVCLRAENLALALLFLIGRHFSSNQKLFLFSRFYKRSQLYILYSDDSLDKCQTKSFGKYETSASGNLIMCESLMPNELLDEGSLRVGKIFIERATCGKVEQLKSCSL